MIFDIVKTNEEGGAWLVKASTTVWADDSHAAEKVETGVWSFRTLTAARRFITSVVKTDKRVRMTKTDNSNTSYVYRG